MSSTKVKGGMKKDWISIVRRSPGVTSLVKETGLNAKRSAEASKQLDGANLGYGYHYYYGSVVQTGKQGATFTMWPTNAISADDYAEVESTVRASGAISAEEAKGMR